MPPMLVIYNPIAGRGRVRAQWPQVEAALRAAGVEFEAAPTRQPLDALRMAEQAAGKYSAVVAVGGDGTAHEAVNGLMRAAGAGDPLPLGLVPLGSGDDFAKMLPPEAPVAGKLGLDWRQAVAKIAAGRVSSYDTGHITADEAHPELGDGPRYFINSMDVGFGAHGAVNFTTIPKFITGKAAYLATVLKTLVKYPRLRIRVQVDAQPAFEQPTTMTVVMNGRCFGNSFWVSPDARADDGLFDMMVTQAVSRATILRLIPKIMRGTHQHEPVLRMYRAKRIVLESEAPLAVEADGEIPYRAARRICIAMLPRRLKIFA